MIISLICIGTIIKKMDVDKFRIEIEVLPWSVDFTLMEEGLMVVVVEEIQKGEWIYETH